MAPRVPLPALALCGLVLATAAAAAPSPDQTQQALEQVMRRIQAIEARLAKHRKKESGLEQRLAETEKRAGALQRELERLAESQRRRQDRLEALRAQLRQATRAEQVQRRRLLEQLRGTWLLGRQAPVKLLLNQTEPASLDRALVYYRYLNRARAARLRTWQASRERLARLEQEIERSMTELERLQDERRDALARLRNTQAERRKLLAGLRKTIRNDDARLARLQADRAHLERLLRSLREALADVRQVDRRNRPLPTLRGRLPWPVAGRIRHAFGAPRLGGRSHWRGWLIAAPHGREVHAIHHGRVVFADWLRGFGLLLILDHGDGFMSLYGHNASLYRDVGEWVEAGEVIATVGDTGTGEEPGLYFELRRKGQPLDPAAWLDRRGPKRVARTGGH